MSNISINLSANTAQYTQRLRQAKTDTDRNLIQMERKFEQFGKSTADSLGSINGSLNTMTNFLSGLKGGGIAVGVIAVGVALAGLANAAAQAVANAEQMDKTLKDFARTANMTTEEFIKMKYAVEAFTNLTGDNLGDIFKDYSDKVGDFINTGGGPLMDFFDAMAGKTDVTATKLQQLSGKDGLQLMVSEMEKANLSMAQMVHVMESMGNDASKLLPLLLKNGEALRLWEAKVDSISSKSLLSDQTTEDIKLAKIATEEMGRSFDNMIATDFSPLIRVWTRVMAQLTEVMDFITKHHQDDESKDLIDQIINGEKQVSDLKEGQLKNLKEYNKERLKELEILLKSGEEIRSLGMGGLYVVKNTKEFKEAQEGTEQKILDDINKQIEARQTLLNLEKQALGTANLELNVNKTGVDTTELDKLLTAEANKRKAYAEKTAALYKTLEEARKNLYTEGGLVALEDETNSKIISKTQELIKQNEDLNKAALKKEEDLLRQKLALHAKYAADRVKEEADILDKGAEKEKVLFAASLLELEARRNQENMSASHYHKLREKLEEDHADNLTAIKLGEMATSLALKEISTNDEIEKLKFKHQQEKTLLEKSILEQGLTKQEAELQWKILDKKQADDIFKQQKDINNSLLGLAKSFTMDRASTMALGHEIELNQLQAKFGSEYETNEEYGIALRTLINNQERDKLELKRALAQEELDWKSQFTTDEQERITADHESNMLTLNQQLEDKLISQEVYNQRSLDLDLAKLDAERQLATQRLDILASEIVNLQGNLKEGSKARKMAFAAEKAAAIASVGINMYDSAEKLKTAAAPAGPIAANIAYYASLANSKISMAAMAATAIGQFHSGTDEVDTTGSYILRQGERVVQQAANKDLTNFLASNASKKDGTTIQSDLVIQGDKKLSDAEFEGYLAKHRESLTKLVKLAERENPSLR